MFAVSTRRKLSLLLMGAFQIAYLTPVRAEVVLHGANAALPGPAITVSGNVGQTRGNTLFQSFSIFNILRAGPSASGIVVPAQETVTFTSPTVGGVAVPITNVISRVTGGTSAFTLQKSSLIDGLLTSSIPGANFWFINPNGIIFGGNARLNVGGSFHASTADYIKQTDSNRFTAIPSANELLTSAPPSAFGFLNANPAGIQVLSNAVPVLQVPVGRTLSLVGGKLDVGNGNAQGFLLAPAGRVNLVSVASAGEATFDSTKINGPLNTDPAPFNTREINVDNFTKLGDINIKGGTPTANNPAPSLVDGKEIFIRSGNLTVDNSLVMPGIFTDLGLSNQAANGGQVKVRVAGDVTITGNRALFGLDPGIQTRAGSATAAALTAARDVPDISVEAGGTIKVSGQAQVRSAKYTVATGSPISFGNIAITGGRVELLAGGQISANSFVLGKGGDLSVNAREIVLDGTGQGARFTGLTTQSQFHPVSGDARAKNGSGGTLTVNADTLTMKNGANLTADSFALGRAGDIMINVRNLFLSRDGASTGSIATQSTLADSGNITIRAADRIELNEGRISATTNGAGNGGFVDIVAGTSLTISGANGGIISLTAPPSTPVANQTPGNGGQIIVNTPSLVMNAGTRIDSSTLWGGDAGQIVGNVGSLTLQDGAQIRSQSGGVAVGSGQPSIGNGKGGSITFTADSIWITGSNSAVSTNTFGSGNAGNISLSANQVTVQNGGSVTSESGGTLAGQFFVGSGNAGQITVSTPTLTMANGGAISVKTSGSGNAGNISLNVANFTQSGGARVDSSTSGSGSGGDISITAANSASISGAGTGLFSTASSTGAGGDINVQSPQVQIVNGAIISANSTGTATATAGNVNIITSDLNMQNSSITTGATLADGGNISISTTGSMVQLTDSQITTSVQSGVGGGGNIAIDSDLVVLTDSQILANAFGGPGGNINITADVFLVNSGGTLPTSLAGIVDASSALSTPGTINIEAAFTDVSGEVAQLPEAPLQATELLRASCAARFAGGKASSLVLGGRDGVPIQPGGLLPSPIYLVTETGSAVTGVKTSANDLPARFSLLGSVDSKNRLLTQYSLLPNAKCAF